VSAHIHPSAVVHPEAILGQGVEIGPFCVVEAGARLGDGVKLVSHVRVGGCVTMGEGCVADAFCSLGGPPQDLSYKGEPTTVTIGPRTQMRDHFSVHRGTARGRGATVIGADCYFMAQSHVAHDCIVGDKAMLSQSAVIGGHVVMEEGAIVGGLSAVHQYVRIGKAAFIGGVTALVQDLIPYGLALGNHAELAGLNMVGLKRRGVPRDAIHRIRAAYRLLFEGEGVWEERLTRVAREFADSPQVMDIIDFIQADSRRPLCKPRLA
jgi:UDP-N-acetylglucosamine acyltransferase